ncbi:MAG: cyclic nucleotide-binding domain-containing protein, partial [Desulfobacterales bacterium]
MTEFVSILKNIILFKDLTEEELQQLAAGVSSHTYPLGDYLFKAGAPRSELFIIQSGEVEILRVVGEIKKTIARLGDGNFLGEGAMLDEAAHSNSCRAVVDTRVLVLPREALEDIFTNSPDAARKILSHVARVMAYRLKYSSFGYRSAAVAASAGGKTRMEHDLLGEKAVPADVYYGVQTLRALENYDITGIPLSHFPNFVKALAMVKKSAAMANRKLGDLDPAI